LGFLKNGNESQARVRVLSSLPQHRRRSLGPRPKLGQPLPSATRGGGRNGRTRAFHSDGPHENPRGSPGPAGGGRPNPPSGALAV